VPFSPRRGWRARHDDLSELAPVSSVGVASEQGWVRRSPRSRDDLSWRKSRIHRCPHPRKYPPELLDRGARVVIESGRPIAHVARDLGVPSETLRKYVRQVEADEGRRPDLPTAAEREEIKQLCKEVPRHRGHALGGDVEIAADPTSSTIQLSADPRSLHVREGVRGLKPLTDKDRSEIAKNIDDKVLHGQPISFSSSAVRLADGDVRLTVEGEHGVFIARRVDDWRSCARRHGVGAPDEQSRPARMNCPGAATISGTDSHYFRDK
jgi:transposase